MDEQRMIVFTAGWNSSQWAKKNILSVAKQDYKNFIHIVVDDATTDNTNKIIQDHAHDKLFLYRNANNKKWIKNSLEYLPRHIEDEEDIIVVLDLDDWLAGPDVLKKLNRIYTGEKCWMTYGSFVSASKTGRKTSRPRHTKYSVNDMNKKLYRKIKWCFWHLRTFKAFLWMNIKQEDLKGPDGNWAPYTYDKAIGFPMLEMCPPQKIKFIKDVMYIYNRGNPYASSTKKRQGGGLGGHFRQIRPYPTLFREDYTKEEHQKTFNITEYENVPLPPPRVPRPPIHRRKTDKRKKRLSKKRARAEKERKKAEEAARKKAEEAARKKSTTEVAGTTTPQPKKKKKKPPKNQPKVDTVVGTDGKDV
jgi:glycosyltransferase involved in cell wall biosynthesis